MSTDSSLPASAPPEWLACDVRPDRRMSLEAALERFVQRDSVLYLPTETPAAVRGLVRQFHASGAELTLVCLRAGASHAGQLLAHGLVKKVIAASFGVQYPASQPCPLVQRTHKAGGTEFECWSLVSLVQRLMAGATGVPFLPTRSLAGSDMTANPGYATVADPFGGEPVALVSALSPDITIAHALAADAAGNAIVVPPFEDDLWSARAATRGVIVLAENIVGSDFIRRHANLVRIPAAQVIAVCHTPWGSHPDGFESGLDLGLPISRYARDVAHYRDYAEAVRDPEAFTRWTAQWVTGLDSHASYLERLGIRPPPAQPPVDEHPWDAVYARYVERKDEACTPVDMMIVATARLLRERVLAGDYRTMLVGAGNSRTAGALCYCLLKKGGRTVTMVEGTGRIGHEPLPIPNAARLTATMLTGTIDAYGTLVGGNRPQCIALLGGGEIDEQGNLNSTLGGDRFLTGSGGSNDAASMAAETVVMMRQSARRMVPRARYVTTPGSRIQHLVSDLGVYGKDAQGAFELRQYFATADMDTSARAVAALQEKCGWPLRTAPGLAAAAPPDTEEMSLLRWLTSTA